MTPTETITILRRYNEWRRTDDRYGMPHPDPREIGEAIDAAVEMIDRLEAAEKEREELHALIAAVKKQANAEYRIRVKKEEECARLQAKIEQMERQEPAGTLHDDGCFVWRETAPHQSNYAGWKMVLYALPGAQGEEK